VIFKGVFGTQLRAGACRRDGFLEHLLVKLDADFLDMAGLLFAQQIPRAANVKIMTGELEPRAERVELLYRL